MNFQKIGDLLFTTLTSMIIGFGMFVAVAYNYPIQTPYGEISGGAFFSYLQKITTLCPNGQFLQGFGENYDKICVNVESLNGQINGQCGTASAGVYSTPNSQLCTKGIATNISGTGPWSWTCYGLNGGTNTNCTAPVAGSSLTLYSGTLGFPQKATSGGRMQYFISNIYTDTSAKLYLKYYGVSCCSVSTWPTKNILSSSSCTYGDLKNGASCYFPGYSGIEGYRDFTLTLSGQTLTIKSGSDIKTISLP